MLKWILSSVMLWWTAAAAVAGQSVMLSWNPSEVPDVAGYKIYYGTNSQNYSRSLTVPNTNTATINCLTAGATYFFAAASVDTNGNESALSNEASFAVPVLPVTLTTLPSVAGQFSFSVAGTAGQTCVVETSTDLQVWTATVTNTVPFVFLDESAADFEQRFYRTVTP